MTLDFGLLAPPRPLEPGDPLHVKRPQGSGDELAARVDKGGLDVVAVVGPVGSGKSTELAQASSLLQSSFVVVHAHLDRILDMRRVTEDEVFVRIAQRIAEVSSTKLGAELGRGFREGLTHALPFVVPGVAVPGSSMSARDRLLGAIRDVVRSSSQGQVILLLDGLEKCEPPVAARVLQALLEARDEARLVFVAPYSLVLGSGGYDLHASGASVHVVRALPVRTDQGSEGEQGRAFLCEILRVRLGLDALSPDLESIAQRAAELSGGVPRSFLQLVRGAASYAAMDERQRILREDLDAAARDQSESFGRLLESGDLQRLREADGTAGTEIPTADRLRLFSHGLLLEYRTAQGAVVHPAPLLNGMMSLREAS